MSDDSTLFITTRCPIAAIQKKENRKKFATDAHSIIKYNKNPTHK